MFCIADGLAELDADGPIDVWVLTNEISDLLTDRIQAAQMAGEVALMALHLETDIVLFATAPFLGAFLAQHAHHLLRLNNDVVADEVRCDVSLARASKLNEQGCEFGLLFHHEDLGNARLSDGIAKSANL